MCGRLSNVSKWLEWYVGMIGWETFETATELLRNSLGPDGNKSGLRNQFISKTTEKISHH